MKLLVGVAVRSSFDSGVLLEVPNKKVFMALPDVVRMDLRIVQEAALVRVCEGVERRKAAALDRPLVARARQNMAAG